MMLKGNNSEWLFNGPYRTFKLLGVPIYFKYESDKHWKFRVFELIMLFFIILILSLEILFFILCDTETFARKMFAIPVVVVMATAALNFLLVFFYKPELTAFVHQLSDIFPALYKDQLTTDKYILTMRRYILMFLVFYLVSGCLFNFIPIISTWVGYFRDGVWEPTLPFAFWYPFDPYQNFAFHYITQVFAGFLGSIIKIVPESFLILGLTQINMHFEVLGQEFRDIVNEISHKRSQGEDLVKSKKKLKDLIARHNLLLEICKNLDRYYGPIELTLLVGGSLLICFSGFIIITTTDQFTVCIFSVFFLSSSQLAFIMCYFGEQLIMHSTNVANYIYSSDWYSADSETKKFVLLVIMRAQRPACLTALKFKTIGAPTFSSIMSTAFSYLTLLRQLYEAK